MKKELPLLPNKPFLKPREIAELLGVGRTTVYRWVDEGILPGVKISGCLRIPREALDEILRENII